VIDAPQHWLRDHAGKVLAGCAAALLTVSLLTLGTSLLGHRSAETDAQARQLVVTLEHDLGTSRSALEAKHEKLLTDLPGVDSARVGRDVAAGRSVLLSLTASSASTRDVQQTQASLDARYDFLHPTSRVLTEFIPDWLATASSAQGVRTTYALGTLDIDVSGVHGPDYGYVGLARLDPVEASTRNAAPSEYVLFGYSTTPEGTVASFEACRASSRTRDAFAATEKQSSAKVVRPASPTQDSAPRTGG
jgi:hypothetical protein